MLWFILNVCLCVAVVACLNTDVNIEAVPGENITLFSTYDLNWTSFECRRDLSDVVLYRQNKIMPHCCPQFEGRAQVSTEGNLSVVLTNVTHKDSGVYTCELLDSREEAKRPRVFSIILKVAEHVKIDAEPGDDVPLFSTSDLKSTSFECSRNSSLVVKFSQNKTMPEYGPKFKGRALVLRDGNLLSVVLTNVTHKDSGVYTCELEPLRVLNITLTVADGAGQPADEDKKGLIIWLIPVFVVVCILSIVCFIYCKCYRAERTERPEII